MIVDITLDCELNDSSIFTKRVDGVAREKARVLSHCGHDLRNREEVDLIFLEHQTCNSPISDLCCTH